MTLLEIYLNRSDFMVESNLDLDHFYSTFFHVVIFLITLYTAFKLSFNTNSVLSYKENTSKNRYSTIFLFVAIVLFVGFRTSMGVYIQDTKSYIWGWRLVEYGFLSDTFWKDESDWLFYFLQTFFLKLGCSFEVFMTFIAILYVGSNLLSCKRLMKDNIWLAFLFFVSSYSFFGPAVNGLRNGVACQFVLLGCTYMIDKNVRGYIISFLLFILAFSFHRSSTLPILCVIFAVWFVKEPKYAITFWVASIIISLIAGNAVGNFFQNLGFDERTAYFQDVSTIDSERQGFSSLGFRWDFLLYSAMPVLFVYYLTIIRDFKDRTFNILCVTYILANSFWIMVIRATFSNRFAALSWFLYPVVIAYPLLRMNIWDKQDRVTALFLFLMSGFTMFMFLIGK